MPAIHRILPVAPDYVELRAEGFLDAVPAERGGLKGRQTRGEN